MMIMTLLYLMPCCPPVLFRHVVPPCCPGMLALGFYLVALMLPNWSTADRIDLGLGLDDVSEATFGLRQCTRHA